MILCNQSLEKLRQLINEETAYRSGPQLVQFFNQLGFQDSYSPGFPSRWKYTDEKLAKINGSPKIDKCIRILLSPANFIEKAAELDHHIAEFNKYLSFDKWKVLRKGADITFKRLDKIEYAEASPPDGSEDEFLQREFANVTVKELGLESAVGDVLQKRIKEIEKCYAAKSPLAVIILAGSTLEGVLLGLANSHPKAFNSSAASPKDQYGKVKQFHGWSLANQIEVAQELDLIQHDTYKFSHTLREFRNYIHPFEQMSSGFSPREHTAKICLQVLRAALAEIHANLNKIST